MNKRKFILSDEQVNSYGFKVLTSGIDLKRFKDNPVMLFQHDANKVLGKWTGVEVKDNKLQAIPEFDDDDQQALSISKKVDKGYINGASIGMHILEVNSKGKVPVVTKSVLFETSIVTIPSNGSALQIMDKNGRLMTDKSVYTQLGITPPKGEEEPIKPEESEDLKTKLQEVLGLEDATDEEIIEAVTELKNGPVEEELRLAFLDGRIKATDKAVYRKLLVSDFNHGKKLLGTLTKLQKLEIIHEEGNFPSEWTLNDYRKKAPRYLRKNPEFYQELLAKEQSKY